MKWNPLKGRGFYIGCILALLAVAGININPSLMLILMGLPGVVLLILITLIYVLHVIAICGSEKYREYAKADIRNFTVYVANKVIVPGHLLLGISFIAFLHFSYVRNIGYDLLTSQILFLVAMAFYVFGWLILQGKRSA